MTNACFTSDEFFGLTAEELVAPNGDGYTKEDLVILDATAEQNPWCATIDDAMEKANCYRAMGYNDVVIIKSVNQNEWYHYFVICV